MVSRAKLLRHLRTERVARFVTQLLWFIPGPLLSPILQFRKDGWNSRIYDSTSHSNVLSVVIFGGYLGDSTEAWFQTHPGAAVHVFEPVKAFANTISARFERAQIHVYPFAIGRSDEIQLFGLSADATSSINVGRSAADGQFQDVVKVEFRSATHLSHLIPEAVDVLEINIEGGEYELIQLLHETSFLKKCKNVFIQFHQVGNKTGEKVQSARALLSSTHRNVWCYDMVWEYWIFEDKLTS